MFVMIFYDFRIFHNAAFITDFSYFRIFGNPFRMNHGSSDSGSKDMELLSDQFDIRFNPTKSYVRNT